MINEGQSEELLPTEPRQRVNSVPTLRPPNIDKNSLAEEHVRRVIEGQDMLAKFAKSEIRLKPVLAGYATKMIQIRKEILLYDGLEVLHD